VIEKKLCNEELYLFQEFPIVNAVKFPEYSLKSIDGVSHQHVFNIVCIYDGLEEKGIGSTKKGAKSLVAQRMFDRVSNIDVTRLYLSQLEVCKNSQSIMQTSIEVIINRYFKLGKMKFNQNDTKNNSINEVNRILKNSYSNKNFELIMKELINVINVYNHYLFSINEFNNPMTKLIGILGILNIKIEKMNYSTSKKRTVCSIKLNTNPIISEMTYGRTIKKAKLNAILHIAETVFILFF
jgi:hypothetical protein